MEIITLGPPRLVDAGDAVRLPPKSLAVLAFVAVADDGGLLRRDTLLARFWPDLDREHARNALNQTLHQLRGAAGEGIVESRGQEELVLGEGVGVDARAFEALLDGGDLEEALELYGGPFLEGFHLSGAPGFERWVDGVRARLARRYGDALESLAEERTAAGDLTGAVRAWRRRASHDRYDSRVAARLVEALEAAGNRAEALRVARAHQRLLEEELELTPPDEFRGVVERLEGSPPAASSGAEAPGTRGPPGASAAEGSAVEAGAPSEGPVRGREDGRAAREAGRRPRGGGRRLGTPGVALAAAGLLAAGAWYLAASGGEPPPPPDRSVAVLPFDAIGAGEPDPVARGLHGDLLTRLSTVSGLAVVSATSVERYGDADLPLPALADSLGVRWIVEGDVQRVGDAIQVDAKLVDPRTGTHAWADTYRRELTAGGLFEVEAEISRRVAGALAARIDSGEAGRLTRRPTGDLEAYRFYLRGRGLLEQRKPSAVLRSLDYFDRAVTEDSALALAWAGRADALAVLARFPRSSPDTLLPRAREAADRALALEPDLAEAHLASGRLHMYRRDARAALRAFDRATTLRPGYAAAHAWLAKLELSIGRPEEALEDAERAVELNPLSPENLGTLAIACHANDRVRRVREITRRIRRLTGEPVGHERVALAHLSRLEELRAQYGERGMSVSEHPLLALYVAEAGGSPPLEEALVAAQARGDSLTVALLRAVLGDEDRALDILHRLYPRGGTPWDLDFTVFLRYGSYWPETLGALREHPRYRALMREINVRWGLGPDGSLPRGMAATAG